MNGAEKIVNELRRQLTQAQANNRERNLELDALHYVWCDGGCDGGVHRWTEDKITEELVLAAERNTWRLRRWYENNRRRRVAEATGTDKVYDPESTGSNFRLLTEPGDVK